MGSVWRVPLMYDDFAVMTYSEKKWNAAVQFMAITNLWYELRLFPVAVGNPVKNGSCESTFL